MSDNQQFCLRWNNHQSTLVQVIDSLLSSGVLVDCTLAAEGQYLHAHKVVLCACSPYLETLLSQHYEKHPIVILKDVKFQELKSMMDYMYKGEVNISQDQLGQFLKAAESLQIKGLTDGGGGENDAKDVGTSAHNKRHDPPPIRKSVPPNQSRSSVVLPSHSAGLTIEPSKRTIPSHLSESQPDSPIRSREGSSSPTPRKRRRPRRPSQGDDDGHQDNCDLPMQQQSILNTVPIIPQLPAGSSSTITKAPPPDDEPDQPAESDVRLAESGLLKEKIEPQSELLIEPKTEYMEETNNDDSVEDLTLDDDDEYDNMDGAGPSHGGDNSNQSYGQWQMGERTHDDVFMAAQEAVGGGPRDSQECIRVKTEPNDVEMCSPLALQLNNSDWSISPSSGSLSDDNVLSPVSENEVESITEDIEDSNIPSPVSVNGVENTVEDVEGSSAIADYNESSTIAADDTSSYNGMIVDIASNGADSQVPETNEQFEEELLADSATNIGQIHPNVENGPQVCQMIVENNHSEIFNGPTDMIHSEDDLSDIELCLESPVASPHPSNHVTDTHQTDQHNVPKQVEVISLEQKEAEIDCGVEPLSDRLTSESSPSPVSISPPPPHIVTPAEMVDQFIASAPWKNPPPTKQTSAKSKTPADVVKHGSVIIRARGKILRKSSRKKNLTNKKLTARRRDSFQEYLEQAFDLKPFMIRLDRHRNESEINESEKLHFLSNFHLKKKSVFPLYSEHQKRAEFNSPRRKPPLKAKRSQNKKGAAKPKAVARKRTTPKPDLSRYSRCIQGVIIERWDENAYRRPIEIHDEHSYSFRENENERRLSTDFSLAV